MKAERKIRLDWYGDFGIEVIDCNTAYQEMPISIRDLPEVEYRGIEVGETKTFTHKEYAFKFSSHELNYIDLKTALTYIEKMLVCEQWGWAVAAGAHIVDRIKINSVLFDGNLKVFDLKYAGTDLPSSMLNDNIKGILETHKNIGERPVFFRRIPWELHIKPKPLWYPDSGYGFVMDFDKRKMRRFTTDEIVNNASLYTRFSTGFV